MNNEFIHFECSTREIMNMAIEQQDPFQSPDPDITGPLSDEYSRAFNYPDDILRGLLAAEEWADS